MGDVGKLTSTFDLLRGSVEALVLSYSFNEEEAVFRLVCEHWAKDLGADRAFVEFTFHNVAGFRRIAGIHPVVGAAFGRQFSARKAPGAWTLHLIDLEKGRALRNASVSMGEAFGGFGFRFESVTHATVNLRAVRDGAGDWNYFRTDTTEQVDLFDPFERCNAIS